MGPASRRTAARTRQSGSDPMKMVFLIVTPVALLLVIGMMMMGGGDDGGGGGGEVVEGPVVGIDEKVYEEAVLLARDARDALDRGMAIKSADRIEERNAALQEAKSLYSQAINMMDTAMREALQALPEDEREQYRKDHFWRFEKRMSQWGEHRYTAVKEIKVDVGG